MFFISLESTFSVEIIWHINNILRVKNRLLRIGRGVCNAVAVLVTFPCTELSGNKKPMWHVLIPAVLSCCVSGKFAVHHILQEIL